MIELQQVSKHFQHPQTGEQVYAVRDLSITFASGELTTLLGPSGCGKTTTLRMINRLTEPSSGKLRVDGQDIQAVRPEVLRRQIGYVIQQAGLFPHLTVAQNIATVPDLLGRPKAQTRARVLELLELVGLEPSAYAQKRPAELSGGQAQRVGVARALAADPPTLLMDEPFGALDPLARSRLQEALLDIQARLKKTVVLVTHDIDEALRLGDKVALMNAGTVAQFGTPDELVRQPNSEFVSRFLGPDAYLRQLAAVTVRQLAKPVNSADPTWATIPGDLDARSALSVMLRDGQTQLAVLDEDGQVRGALDWEALEQV